MREEPRICKSFGELHPFRRAGLPPPKPEGKGILVDLHDNRLAFDDSPHEGMEVK
jgi:hypothetical protein